MSQAEYNIFMRFRDEVIRVLVPYAASGQYKATVDSRAICDTEADMEDGSWKTTGIHLEAMIQRKGSRDGEDEHLFFAALQNADDEPSFSFAVATPGSDCKWVHVADLAEWRTRLEAAFARRTRAVKFSKPEGYDWIPEYEYPLMRWQIPVVLYPDSDNTASPEEE